MTSMTSRITEGAETVLDQLDQLLAANPVVPVVVVDSAAQGVGAGRALVAGGIATAEVAFRTAAAVEAIRVMGEVEGLVVGAGTVLDAAQAEAAIDAGARYLVSPGLSVEVVRCARGAGVPVLPGCADASWIMAALELGIRTVKFFPASALGGPSAIRALSAAFPRVRFVPTGGVSAGNLAEYLAVPQVAACGGSWMVSRELVAAARWDEISRLCARAVAIAKEAGR